MLASWTPAHVALDDAHLRFGVLGTFRVERDGQPVDPGPRLQRTLLAILLMDAGHVVPAGRLIDLLWRDGAPPAATASLQAYVSQLRRVLEPGRPPRAPAAVLVTQEPGYVLRVDGEWQRERFGTDQRSFVRRTFAGAVHGMIETTTRSSRRIRRRRLNG